MSALWSVVVSLITSATAITIWQLVLSKVISRGVDAYFQRKLESHKHQLEQISERKKFDYQRWATDFNLYTSKKHEVYSELFRLVLIADGSLESLVGLRQLPSFEEYNKADMEKYLREYPVVEGYVQELLNNWSNNRDSCVAKIREYLYMVDFQKADKARQDAKNYFVVNILYLSDTLEAYLSELFSKLVVRFVIERQSLIGGHYDDDSHKRSKEASLRKEELLILIKNKMKEELSVGYYEKDHNP